MARKRKSSENSDNCQEMYKVLFESSSDAIMLLDSESFFDCNQATLDMFQMDKKEFTSVHPSEISPPYQPNGKKSKAEANRHIKKAFKDGSDRFEWVHRRKDGTDFSATVWLTVFPSEEGPALQATVRDISEQKGIEKALVDSEARFRGIWESVQTGIVIIDTKTRKIVDINNKGLEMIGAPKKKIIGKVCHEFICPSEIGRCPILDLGQKAEDMERSLITAQGKEIPIQKSVTTFKAGEKEFILDSFVDISQQKEAEKELKQVKEKLEAAYKETSSQLEDAEREVRRLIQAVGTSLNAVAIFDMNLKIIYANNSFSNLVGQDNLIGVDAMNFIAKEHREKLMEKIEHAMQGESVERFEIQAVRKDGEKRWVEIVGSVVWDSLGEPEGLLAIVRDVHERREMEKTLTEVEDKYELLVEKSMDGVLIIQDGKVAYMNPALVKLSGYKLEEQIGRDYIENVAPEARKAVGKYFKSRMEGKKVPNMYETTLLKKDGTRVPVEVNAAIMDYNGKPADFVYLRDLTERKKAEESIRLSEERFRTVIENLPDAVFAHDFEGNIIMVNQVTSRNTGYAREELLGMTVGDIDPESITRDDRKELWLKLNAGEQIRIKSTHVRKDGTEYPAEVSLSAIILDDEPIILGVAQDITERNKAEEQLKVLNQQFEYVLGATRTGFDTIDEDYNVTYVDPVWARELGDFKGKKCYDYFMGEKEPCETCAIPEALETGKMTISEEYLKKEDRWVQVHTIPLGVQNGKRIVAEFNIDITENRKAEEALRQSEEKYRKLIETANDAIFLADAETGIIIDANRKAEELVGRTHEEIIGMNQSQLHPKNQAKKYKAMFQEHVEDGSAMNEGIYALHKDGHKIPVSISAATFELDGKPVIQGIFHDLTEKEKATELIRASENRLRAISDNASDFIFTKNRAREYTFVNPAMQKLLGLKEEEILGKKPHEVFEKDAAATIKEVDDKTFSGNVVDEVEVIKLGGSRFHLHTVQTPLELDEKGDVITIMGIVRDITPLKEAEERLQTFFDSMVDMVFVFDRNENFEFYHTQESSVLYTDPDNFLGKHYMEVMPPDVSKKMEKAFKSNRKGKPESFEYSMDLGEMKMWFSANMSPIMDGKEYRGTIAVVRDMTPQKEAEEELLASEKIYKSLYESTIALADTTDLEEVISVIAEEATNMLAGECSTIYLWNAQEERLRPFYTNAEGEKDKFMEHKLALGEGLTGTAAQEKEGIFSNFDDDKPVKGYIPGTGTHRDHLQSIIAVPMTFEGELIGVINVIAEERKFDVEDISRMDILAHQATIAYLRSRNLEALTQSEGRFRRMVENIHDGLTIIEGGNVVFVNERACDIFGYSAEELMEMDLIDLIIPEEREQMKQILENAERTGFSIGELEFWVEQKSGERRYVRTRMSTSIEGQSTSQFIITTDITDRKLAEEEAKRKMMKFYLEDGRAYLVKEFKPELSIEAFRDLINIDYPGLLISRTARKDLDRQVRGPFEHEWLGQKDVEDVFAALKDKINHMPSKSVILLDRLDYLIFKYGFRETLAFLYDLRDMVYVKDQILLISIDPSTISDEELMLIEKEMGEIEQRQVARPKEEQFEIVEKIFEKNSSGIKPSFSEVGAELGLSKPTFRKRVRRLIANGYVVELTKGNKKVLELTQKGRSLFFK